MDKATELTIIIPIRIDSKERLSNLLQVILLLEEMSISRFIIIEADSTQKIPSTIKNRIKIDYQFIEDKSSIFHHTMYINYALQQVTTLYAGIWDADVIVSLDSIELAIASLEQGYILAYPYDGRFVPLDEVSSLSIKSDIKLLSKINPAPLRGRPSYGGAFLVKTKEYLQMGGENERFYGWGPEDEERVRRVELLGGSVFRSPGCLYHLHHPRGINSKLGNGENALRNLNELIVVCSLSPSELKSYIPSIYTVSEPCKKKTLVLVGNMPVSSSEVDSFDYVIRLNHMSNYKETGTKTSGIYLEANSHFKATEDPPSFKDKAKGAISIFMKPYWLENFSEWAQYLTPKQYFGVELIDEEILCQIIGHPRPTSGVLILAHLLNSQWINEYDIYIIGFELKNRVRMIDKDPYWAWHHGAGEAESAYLNNCIKSGLIKVLGSTP